MTWTCKNCGWPNFMEDYVCRHCGKGTRPSKYVKITLKKTPKQNKPEK